MSRPDATASTALGAKVLRPAFVGWLDFVGDPLRATTAPYPVTFAGTGDSDLDGNTFDAFSAEIATVSEVQHQEQGSSTVTCTLGGLIGPNTDLLNIIGDRSKWQGRSARLWVMLLDADAAQLGNIWSYYTGYMLRAAIKGSPEAQVIEVQIESYLAAMSEASNRTYLDQASFDSGDLSAAAAIAIANGRNGNGLSDYAGAAGMPSAGHVSNVWWQS